VRVAKSFEKLSPKWASTCWLTFEKNLLEDEMVSFFGEQFSIEEAPREMKAYLLQTTANDQYDGIDSISDIKSMKWLNTIKGNFRKFVKEFDKMDDPNSFPIKDTYFSEE